MGKSVSHRELQEILRATRNEKTLIDVRLRKTVHQLSLLTRASFAILEKPDFRETGQAVLLHALRVTGSRCGLLLTRDPQREWEILARRRMRKAHGFEEDRAILLRQMNGILEALIKRRKPVLSNALPHKSRPEDESASSPFPTPYLAVPLIAEGHVTGSIVVAEPILKYGEEEIRILSFFANSASLALQRRRTEETNKVLLDKLSLAHSLLERQVDERTRALRRSERMYQDLYENAPDMYLNLDPEGMILKCNRTGFQVLGYHPEEFLGKSIFDFLSESSGKTFRSFLHQIVTHEKKEGVEVDLTGKSGKTFTFHLYATLITGSDEKPIMILGIFRDITLKKQLEHQVIQAQKLDSLGTLAGGIAHDFNNILLGILGYTSFLKSLPEVDEKILPYLEVIENSSKRAARLSRRILTFTRGSENQKFPLDLHQIIEEACILLEKRIPGNVEMRKDLRAQSSVILGDSVEIEQVLMNICLNALDAMPSGGILHIRTQNTVPEPDTAGIPGGPSPGEYIELTVRDTGTGIPPEIQDRIFDPFFTTKERGKGTGLGLAMVYGIVRNHQGKIEVSSTPGQGALFRILFPVSQESPVPSPPLPHISETDASALNPKETTILVVDDEEVIRMLTQEILSRKGYRVLQAGDGETACEIFKKERIDLVLLDMTMPGMDGKETYERISSVSPEVRVIFSTGYSKDNPLCQATTAGKTGFLQKPYVMEELIREIERLLLP